MKIFPGENRFFNGFRTRMVRAFWNVIVGPKFHLYFNPIVFSSCNSFIMILHVCWRGRQKKIQLKTANIFGNEKTTIQFIIHYECSDVELSYIKFLLLLNSAIQSSLCACVRSRAHCNNYTMMCNNVFVQCKWERM